MSLSQNSRIRQVMIGKIEQGNRINRQSDVEFKLRRKRIDFANHPFQLSTLEVDQEESTPPKYVDEQNVDNLNNSLDLNLLNPQSVTQINPFWIEQRLDDFQIRSIYSFEDTPPTLMMLRQPLPKQSNDDGKMIRLNSINPSTDGLTSYIKPFLIEKEKPTKYLDSPIYQKHFLLNPPLQERLIPQKCGVLKEQSNQHYEFRRQQTPTKIESQFNFAKANTSVKKPPSNLIQVKDYGFYKSNMIGCGSFSKVYRGHLINDHSQLVAIKEIKISEVGQKKLMQEINIHQIMANSPYIVKLVDYYFDNMRDTCYLVLEYCHQGSLDKAFKTFSKIKSLAYFSQIMEAMKDLHKNNIIHRDLKLENILIKNNQIKLADFGFARPLPEDTLSVYSQKCGTPATMAPELIFNENQRIQYTDKQDVWSLGVILHELVYKEHPFAQNKDRMRLNQRVFIKQKDQLVEGYLSKSLIFDPNMRMSLMEAFNQPICQQNQNTEPSSPKTNPIPPKSLVETREVRRKICFKEASPVQNIEKKLIKEEKQKFILGKNIFFYSSLMVVIALFWVMQNKRLF